MYKSKGEIVNEDTNDVYIVSEVIDVVAHDPDHIRRLYRILKNEESKKFYRGICVSRTNIAVAINNETSEDDFWEDLYSKYVESPILHGDESNVEIEMADTTSWKGLDSEDGTRLPEIITNVRIGNLANDYGLIPGGQN